MVSPESASKATTVPVLPPPMTMSLNRPFTVVVAMIGANEFQGYAIEGEDLEPGSFRWSEI